MTPDEARQSIQEAEDLRANLPIDCWRALETVAGMREEWGVKWDDDPNGPPDWGFPTRAAAEQWGKKHRHRGPGRGHIIRCYVTEPEEA